MIAEAHVFAEKTGLGSAAMEMLIQENYGPLAYTMSKRLTSGAYEPPRGIYFLATIGKRVISMYTDQCQIVSLGLI